MNKVVTSREEILKRSRELIRDKGYGALNIRSVAKQCNVAVGSIYNYFTSKSELIAAVVASVWGEIFTHPEDKRVFFDSILCIDWIYARIKYGAEQYPNFLSLHSLIFMSEDSTKGKELMQSAWLHIQKALEDVLLNDTKIRKDAFNSAFTAKDFAKIEFDIMLASMLRNDFDNSSIRELIKRTLY